MKSHGKAKGQVARKGAARPLLKRLKPDEAAAVLRCLLEAHPDLASEAGRLRDHSCTNASMRTSRRRLKTKYGCWIMTT